MSLLCASLKSSNVLRNNRPNCQWFFSRLSFARSVFCFILISDKKWTKICEDIFRKTRRRTPQGWRLARTTTKYCGKQTAKIVYFLFEFSIKLTAKINLSALSRSAEPLRFRRSIFCAAPAFRSCRWGCAERRRKSPCEGACSAEAQDRTD